MIGRQIGRYTITQELGRGGMGIVYKATQVTLNRTVAVKMLFPHLASTSEYLARFRREAETLARLDHENVVRIYDIEELDDTHCIIMEYVAGPSLSRILARERRLPPHRARAIAADIAGALSAAHRQGIIHRDIKPDNILFSADGRPKLTDFGIARMADANAATRTGIMIGTPSYMSPEQAAGRAVTPASDLYSLGVVLFEMLAGRVPFVGADALAVALMHLNDAPPRLDSLVSGLPLAACDLVARALAKNPTERFSSAHELREALLALHLPADGGQLEPSLAAVAGSLCPECSCELREDFLTCPRCGLSIRQRCSRCERLYDPLSDECPFCRTPATPLPGLSTAGAEARVARVAPSDDAFRLSGARAVATGVELPGSSSAGPDSTALQATSLPGIPGEAKLPGSAGPAAPGCQVIPAMAAAPAGSAGHMAPATAAAPAGAVGPATPGVPAVPPIPVVSAIPGLAGALGVLRRFGDRGVSALRRLPYGEQVTRRPVVLWIGAGVVMLSLGFGVLWRPGATGHRPVDGGATAGNGAQGAAALAEATAAPAPQLTPEDVEAITRAAGDSAASQPAGGGGEEPASNGRGHPQPAAPAPGVKPKPAPEPEQPAEPAVSDEERMRAGMASTEAARAAIIEVVDRQRMATESGDLDMLLRDVAPELQAVVRASSLDLHASVTAVHCSVSRLNIGFGDDGSAQVRFRVKLTGVRLMDKRSVTLNDGPVVWRLDNRGGRWLITGM